MKTSVVMVRKLTGFDILQRTMDGYFDGNSLLLQWNKSNDKRRRLDDFFSSKSTIEFIEVLNEEIAHGEIPSLAVKHKKGRNTKKGRTKDEVWMHPYLFIDFAMWINPKFKLHVIKFVYDELIKARHDAGDYYRTLSSSGTKLKGYNYSEVAKALQWIVFNRTEKNIRQNATESELKELVDIQHKLAWSIDMGFIKSYERLISEMKNIWRKKYKRIPLSA